MACTDDFNCTGTLVCYNDVPWDNRESFCDCSFWYGWTGPDCDEYGPTAKFTITMYSIMVMGLSLILGVAIMDLSVFVMFESARVLNKGNVTWIYSTISLILAFIFCVSVLGSVTSPEGHTNKLDSNAVNEKLPKYSLIERLSGMLSCTFAVLASLNVSLVWLEVSYKIRKMSMKGGASQFYTRVVYGFQLGFVVVVLVAAITGAFFIAFLLALPYVLCLGGTFIVGRRRFAAILDNSAGNSNNSAFKKLADQVRNTSLGVIVSMCFFFVFGFVYSLLSYIDWRIYSPRDGYSAPAILLSFSFLTIIIWATFIFWYSHQALQRMKNKLASASKSGNQKTEDGTGLASPTTVVISDNVSMSF